MTWLLDLYWDVHHRVHFWRHRGLHADSCICLGTGRIRAARKTRDRERARRGYART
jgi:hypothetical protein